MNPKAERGIIRDGYGQEIPVHERQPPYPADKSVGPAISDLIMVLGRVADGQAALLNQARFEARERAITGRSQFQTDGSGNGAVELCQVPQGATGYLMFLGVNQDGQTPASPVTNANLYAQISGLPGGVLSFAQVITGGSYLDGTPLSPAADAQLPYTFTYGDRLAAPALVGPLSFYLAVGGATAARVIYARWNVLVVQPEP